MKLKKFARKIENKQDEFAINTGENVSEAVSAEIVLGLLDERRDVGKTSDEVERLENAANAVIEAAEEFNAAMSELFETAYAD